MAAGSTEEMDYDAINKDLENASGIKGIEVSYQNLYQPGITPEFWKIANKKADNTRAPKTSRTYMNTKYKWAPTGLGVYVSNKDDQTKARKAMMKKFSTLKNGELPVWPGGARMGFVPLKNGYIKSERTRNTVKKRFQYHIWLKTREQTIRTEFKNIHNTIPELKGKTFH